MSNHDHKIGKPIDLDWEHWFMEVYKLSRIEMDSV